jgi:hypothetical protein
MTRAIDHQNDQIDAMLSALDADLEYSRNLMRAMEERERQVDWADVKRKAVERTNSECPVCLREMQQSQCEVTSCGHLFHQKCLESWLTFCGAQDKQPTCPVCRSLFQRQHLVDTEEPAEPVRGPAKKKAKEKPDRQRWH